MSVDRKAIKAVARKTLGRSKDNVADISFIYLAHLRHFLTRHPKEDNFIINLDDGVGAVYCCVCDLLVPPGKGSPEENGVDIYGSLANYEEHLSSQSHTQGKRRNQALDGQSLFKSPASKTSQTEKTPTHNRDAQQSSSPLRLASDGSTPTRRIQLANSGRSEIPGSFQSTRKGGVHMRQHNTASSNGAGPSRVTATRHMPAPPALDADYELALQLHRELNGLDNEPTSPIHTVVSNTPSKQQNQSGMDGDSQACGSFSPAANDNFGPTVIDVDEMYGEELVYEDVYQAQITTLTNVNPDEKQDYYTLYRSGSQTMILRCDLCKYQIELPGSGRVEDHFGEIADRMREFEEHLESRYHCHNRQEAPVGLPVYNPSAISNLLNPISYQEQLNLSLHSSYHSSPPLNLQEDSNNSKRKLPGEWEDDATSDPFSSGFAPASAFNNGGQDGIVNNGMGGHQVGIGMDYHQQDPLQHSMQRMQSVPAIRHLDEARLADYSNYGSRSGSNSRDFQGNYDDSPSNSKLDAGSSDPESRFRDFMNKALDDFKGALSVTDAQVRLKLARQDDPLDGMAVRLLPHQIIGVAWMVEQEKDFEKNGGILADAMGLGKTVQMIATMAANRPPKRSPLLSSFKRAYANPDDVKGKGTEPNRHATLILAPASLLQQWSEEFRDKAAPNTFRVHVHHGKDKLKSAKEIEDYDVIITSYQTLTMDIPKLKKTESGDRRKDDQDDSDLELQSSDSDTVTSQRRSVGPLARVKWLRIVIDEAQNIRNRSTRISKCVAKLDSRYRWCLTGTPVTNSLADLYGYMRFCRFEPWNNWKWFNDRIAKVQKKRPAVAGERAQTALGPHLLRRTKDSKIDGRPIIELGPKDINMVELDFSPEEREMYARVESNQKQIVSKFYRDGTVMKNYAFILVMILRLRQLCCHPSLATTKSEDEEKEEEPQESQQNKAKKIMGEQKFAEIANRFLARIKARMLAEVAEAEADDDECAICMEPYTRNRKVTVCGHEFCSECLNEVIRASEGGEADEDGAQCPLCRASIDRKRIFSGAIFEPSQEEVDEIARSLPAADGQPRPAKRMKLEDKLNELTLDGTPEPTKEKFEPSTKMRHMLDTLLQWFREAPDDKVIVYSQWTSMLELVDNYLKESGFETLRYDGKMNRLARGDAVTKFKNPKGPRIMLISLKCGGVGLNLTCANRVVNLDLAWNYATEAQAYDRVHRLGQHKAVTIQRVIIKNTIEERIMRLQAKKQGLSDAALGEGTAGKIKRMTAREIAQLFDLKV